MSLYGALFGAVSGLSAQSSKIGVISDNIANSSTIAYKEGKAVFESLVINASTEGIYQTGGVRTGTRYLIDKQGLLQSTESTTDIAISGAGFFVVRADSAGETSPLYTRAGSFSQNELGDFVNTSGYFLQGWPLDREGRLPGETGNLNSTSFTNFDSLVTVNVESASGTASPTTTIALGANLKASQSVYPGQAATLTPDSANNDNFGAAAKTILVGADYGLGTVNSVRRGDQFTISTGSGQIFTYEYGGYAVSRDVTDVDPNTNIGDGGIDHVANVSLGAATIEYSALNTFRITIPGHNLITGDNMTLSGFAAIGATPAVELNAIQTITWVDADTVQFTVATPAGVVFGSTFGGAGQEAAIRRYDGNVLDATGSVDTFLGITGVTDYSVASRTFTIQAGSNSVRTFTYTTTTPNALDGEFNNMTSLANAIDGTSGLTARLVDGRLLISSDDSSESLTFANGDAVGDVGSGTTRGIDWVEELDLHDVSADNADRRFNSLQGLADAVNEEDGISAVVSDPLVSSTLSINVDDPQDTIQFFDLELPSEINAVALSYPIELPAAGAYNAGDNIDVVITGIPTPAPEDGDFVTISGLTAGLGGLPENLPNGTWEVVNVNGGGGTFTVRMITPMDVTLVASGNGGGNGYDADVGNVLSTVGKSNQGSLLATLGLIDSLGATEYINTAALGETAVLGPQYDPTGAIGENMASGDITAQFSRNVRIYDSLGSGHDIRFSFIKIASNRWAVEAHAIPDTDVTTSGALVDGQVAVGTMTFNGDGSLRSIDVGLSSDIVIAWTNGSLSSTLNLDLGTAGDPFGTDGATVIGLADGMSQFDSSYNVNFANQNGAAVGLLVSVSIDSEGVIIASYSNGEAQSLFKLPLADFPNANGLLPISGNVFAQTSESGEVNLRESGTNGVGSVVSATLEQSNVDIAQQLTEMIIAQRAYQANTRVITVSNDLLEQLNQI